MRLVVVVSCWLVALGGLVACGTDPGTPNGDDASVGTGGVADSGGSKATGGTKATGGSANTGGTSKTGGSKATGGTTTGGSKGTGGDTGGLTCADLSCTAPATCDDSGSEPVCVCPSGYTDDNGDGSQCTDINECDLDTHDCALRATCENTDGSFTCTCDAPIYTGNGKTCSCAAGYTPDTNDNSFCVAENGGDCGDGLDCVSGNCVDGVCCKTACVSPPPCRVGATATCADGETCAYDEVAQDGTDCNDGDSCTSGTTCTSGVCGGGVDSSADCYAAPCQNKICDGFAGCQVSAKTEGCDDGDPCTVGETCQPDGSCGGGTPYVCTDDGNPCTDHVCEDNGGSPNCVVVNNSDYCGAAGCPTKDLCVSGSCQADAGTACNGCTGDPCGAGACTAGSGSDYTCACDVGYLAVNGTCVCDIEGTFAVRVTATLKYDGDANNLLSPFDDVVVHSWIMRTHTISGMDVLVTEQPCGGETPEICVDPANADTYGLGTTEAYSGNIPFDSWDYSDMPKFNGATLSLDTFVPGNAFVTPNEAMVLGLVMANNDLMGTWPATAGDVLDWTNPDGDTFNGVETIWGDTGTSAVCPRGQTPSFDVTLPPALDVQTDGEGNTVGVITRVKYVDGASRIIKAYDGQIDDCDTLSGTVTGPSDASNGFPGQYAADARVRGCRHSDGSACTDAEVNFLDGNTADAPYVKTATFAMKRMAAATTHTCAEVRAVNFD